MNIAVILAGGADPNFEMNIPKQFVHVYNRPIIVYTLERFQAHPEIDAIMVACLKGWEKMVEAYAKQFNIDKLRWIITGGNNAQETSRLVACKLDEECDKDDIVVLHDAIRPLVTERIISDSISLCRKTGMGITAVSSMDNVMLSRNGEIGTLLISRDSFRRIQTPQSYRLGDLCSYHDEAVRKEIREEVDTNNMVAKLGVDIQLSMGSDLNIKVNRVEDVEMFKALLGMQNMNQ